MAAAAQCSSLLCSCSRRPCPTRTPLSLFSPSQFLSPFTATPIRATPKQLKLSTSRTGRVVSAVVSAENTVQSSFSGTDGLKLTYLEVVGCGTYVGGAKILVDPILVGNLDFGIPWLYDTAKKLLKNFQLSDIPEVDCLLITQGLDITAICRRQSLVGSPFQQWRCQGGPRTGPAVATFCRVIVPMTDGDLDAKGLLPSFVSAEGTVESFKELLSKELPDAQVLQPTPVVPLQIPLRPNLP